MKWEDIPVAAKWTTSVVTVLTAAIIWMFTTFETASGAEQWRVQHQQANNCRTVAELRAEVRALTERLRFDTSLTPEYRDWLRQQIANIQADIRRLDPNGVC